MFSGGTFLPPVMSARIVTCAYWMFIVVVVTTYSGSLVSYMTVPELDNPLNDISTLTQKGAGRTWGAQKGTALIDYLKVNLTM